MQLHLSSLADLIKRDEIRSKSTDDKTTKPEILVDEIPIVLEETEDVLETSLEFSSLSNWWVTYKSEHGPEIKSLSINAPGLDPTECIIFVKQDPSKTKDESGVDKIILVPFSGANKVPVVNLPAINFNVYHNGYRMIHQVGESSYITSYGSKSNICIFDCVRMAECLVPFKCTKIKRKNAAFVPSTIDVSVMEARLTDPVDSEILVMMYKQSIKYLDEISTNRDAMNWLIRRKMSTVDINHLIQLDQAIIEIVNPSN